MTMDAKAVGAKSTPISEQILSRWIGAIADVASHFQLNMSPESLRSDGRWAHIQGGSEGELVESMARRTGLSCLDIGSDLQQLSPFSFPVLARLNTGHILTILSQTSDGFLARSHGEGESGTSISASDLQANLARLYLVRPLASVRDKRVDDYIRPYRKDWLSSILLADMRPYWNVALISFLANILPLSAVIFSMQVYDRVIPAQSFPTLGVLFSGVVLATLLAFLMRQVRSSITDYTGKSADLRISDKVFGHMMHVRASARPRSTGTLVSQLRELEHVREMMTSTVVAALADLPFFLIFCVMFWFIAGQLLWVPVLAAILMIVPGLLMQRKLRALAQMNMREGSLRNSVLVESVQGMDDIRALQAESRFIGLWNHYNEVTSGGAMKLRHLVGTLSNWSQTVQGFVFVGVVCVGAPQVMTGDLSTGALVAASLLSSRMLAPLSSVSQLLTRYQQAKLAKEGLDKLLDLPADTPETSHRIHRPALDGAYQLRSASFGYNADQPVLNISRLDISPGERIAVLGRNGAGKSTLLTALAGSLEPASGQLELDGVTMQHIDPSDLRRDIGYVRQDARLFHGTLRDNLKLGAPHADDQALIHLLQQLGAWDFIRHNPDGLDYIIEEGGRGLSGGQAQLLLLARALIRKPSILLLDEPTGPLDEMTEKQVIRYLSSLPASCTMIVATHRPAVLSMLNRIIVVNNGVIARDGPRDAILQGLKAPAQ